MIRNIEFRDKTEYISMATDFYNSPAVINPVPKEHFEKTFSLLCSGTPYAQGFIFQYDSNIAGYGLIAKTYSQEAGGTVVWIEEIYVKEDFRNLGLGSEFIEYVKTNIPAARYRLETEPENLRAQALYSRHGFDPLKYINYSLDIIE